VPDTKNFILLKPENTASLEITEITAKLVQDINTVVNHSVKAIGAVRNEE
jgi:hypothetical protein